MERFQQQSLERGYTAEHIGNKSASQGSYLRSFFLSHQIPHVEGPERVHDGLRSKPEQDPPHSLRSLHVDLSPAQVRHFARVFSERSSLGQGCESNIISVVPGLKDTFLLERSLPATPEARPWKRVRPSLRFRSSTEIASSIWDEDKNQLHCPQRRLSSGNSDVKVTISQ